MDQQKSIKERRQKYLEGCFRAVEETSKRHLSAEAFLQQSLRSQEAYSRQATQENTKDDGIASASASVPTTANMAPGAIEIEGCIAEMHSLGFIDENGVINDGLSKAKFARTLVEEGYVKPRKPWESIFRGFQSTNWEDFESGIFKMSVINELTRELNWEPYGGRFKEAKSSDALTAAQLKRYFIDGDGDCKKRNKVFFKLYRKYSS